MTKIIGESEQFLEALTMYTFRIQQFIFYVIYFQTIPNLFHITCDLEIIFDLPPNCWTVLSREGIVIDVQTWEG